VQICRREVLDRTRIWNQRHLLHALREFGTFCNSRRPHQGIANAHPMKPLPPPVTHTDRTASLDVQSRQPMGGILNEYVHASWPAWT
jgi:putative transposase